MKKNQLVYKLNNMKTVYSYNKCIIDDLDNYVDYFDEVLEDLKATKSSYEDDIKHIKQKNILTYAQLGIFVLSLVSLLFGISFIIPIIVGGISITEMFFFRKRESVKNLLKSDIEKIDKKIIRTEEKLLNCQNEKNCLEKKCELMVKKIDFLQNCAHSANSPNKFDRTIIEEEIANIDKQFVDEQ